MQRQIPSHCERSEAIQLDLTKLDCFVASLLAMTLRYSPSDISAALPPDAAVFTVTVCSVAKRTR